MPNCEFCDHDELGNVGPFDACNKCGGLNVVDDGFVSRFDGKPQLNWHWMAVALFIALPIYITVRDYTDERNIIGYILALIMLSILRKVPLYFSTSSKGLKIRTFLYTVTVNDGAHVIRDEIGRPTQKEFKSNGRVFRLDLCVPMNAALYHAMKVKKLLTK